MKRCDRLMLLITLALLAVCLLLGAGRLFFAAGDDLTAVVTQDGRLLRSIRLKGARPEEFTIKYKSGWNTIRVTDGAIEISGADCPDKDCVKRGRLTRAGDSAVCLPHRLEIRLSGASAVDGATY